MSEFWGTCQSDKTYYYSIYAYDAKPNYSQPAIISVSSAGSVEVLTGGQTTTAAGATGSTLYLTLNGSLYIGVKNQINNIIILQKMLSKDPAIYPEAKKSSKGDLKQESE